MELESTSALQRFERVEAERARAARTRAGRALVVRGGGRVAVDAASRALVFVAHDAGDPRIPQPFLGVDEGDAPLYAHFVDDDDEAAHATLGLEPGAFIWHDPRMDLGRFSAAEREALVTAVALARWSRAERFCSLCAAPLLWEPDGRTKRCTRETAPHRHFPRTDPATIVLVHDGDWVLLGRQSTWPPGMYSTIAGFIEAGESAEDAVAREVFEEVGVRVDDVRYVGSEAWPFPRSLMLGYTARATTHEVRVGEELEDARWFSRHELAVMQARVREQLPHLETIARRLMADWLAA